MKRAPGVEMTELNRFFAVVISDVGVLTSYKHINRYPPTVRRVRCFSVFCGWYISMGNEFNGVGTWYITDALCQSTKFIGRTFYPDVAVLFHLDEVTKLKRLLRQSPSWVNWHALLPAVATSEAHGLLQHNLARICVVGF